MFKSKKGRRCGAPCLVPPTCVDEPPALPDAGRHWHDRLVPAVYGQEILHVAGHWSGSEWVGLGGIVGLRAYITEAEEKSWGDTKGPEVKEGNPGRLGRGQRT